MWSVGFCISFSRPHGLFFRTREETIADENGDNFANLICQQLHFGRAKFIGTHDEYLNFMQKEKLGVNMQLAEDSKACIPEYKIAGGVCSNTAKSLNDVSIVKNRVKGSAEKKS